MSRSPSRSRRSRRSRKISISQAEHRRRSKASPSKGWKYDYPRKGLARHVLKKRCGSKCFLRPSEEKFPVCKLAAKRSRSGRLGRLSCKPDCRALLSAFRRAKQYQYPNVARKAISKARLARCKWV